MSVVVIGDRSVGKSSMVLALAKPHEKQYVEIVNLDYETLQEEYINQDTGIIVPTREVKQKQLILNVDLPTGQKQITSLWIDTPGEIWEKEWQNQNPNAWRGIKETLNQSLGMILLLPPHRDMVQQNLLEAADPTTSLEKNGLMLTSAWLNRLSKWLDFFNRDCNQVQHIVVCLHKADLFCHNISDIDKQFQYRPTGGTPWWKIHNESLSTYFYTAKSTLQNYNNTGGKPVQLLITTVKHRSLLELPWLYLSSFLAYSKR